MRNKGVFLAALAASLASGAIGVESVQADREIRAGEQRGGGSQGNSPSAPVHRAGSFGGLMAALSGSFGYGGPSRASYKNRNGHTGAEAKRRASKARNRLRARGQFREAVR